jgi:putative hemolysin
MPARLLTALPPLLAATEPGWTPIIVHLFLLLVLLLVSGLFSGSEAALFSLSPAQLQQAAASGNPLRRLTARCMANPERTLRNILLANTMVNVLLFSSSFVLFNGLAARFGDWLTPLSAAVSILLVVVCGEVVPKIIGLSLAERVAPFSALLVAGAGYPFAALGRVIDLLLVQPFDRLLFAARPASSAPTGYITPDELKALLELSHRGGVLRRTEDMMLREVINLGYVRVRDVMVPRVEVVACPLAEDPAAVRALLAARRLKKLPVYDGSIDNIVGLVHAKALWFNPDRPLRELLAPVRFVPELITCEQLLHHFRETRSQLAIAVDEFGGMAGLVTLEDVLERVVGEIYDPHDRPTLPELEQRSPTEYDVSGQLSLTYWSETFGLQRLRERVATVGGLVVARLGRPPRVGDTVTVGNLALHVLAVQHRRVERLRVRLIEPATPGADA